MSVPKSNIMIILCKYSFEFNSSLYKPCMNIPIISKICFSNATKYTSVINYITAIFLWLCLSTYSFSRALPTIACAEMLLVQSSM